MKRIKALSLTILLTIVVAIPANTQEIRRLSLDDVVRLASEQSPNALIAKHRFRASYWQYRTFVAEYRPTLTLTGNLPDYSTAYSRVWNSVAQQWEYASTNVLQTTGNLSLAQNIGLTGGSISLYSDLTYEKNFETDGERYITSPLNVRLTQPLFRYNELKWQKKIEPLKYEEARKTYLRDIENVHMMAVQYFFNLALAQINKEIAETNMQNADTLYQIALGRYNLGTIAEDELLQMELSYLNAGTAINESEMNLRDRELKLRSFLGFNQTVRLELLIPNEIPDLEVDVNEVLKLAEQNNPELIALERQLVEAQSSVAQAKAEKGLNANLTASYGLRDQDPILNMAYDQPNKQQTIRVGFSLPILDWGQGRGRYKMAQSSEELTRVQVEQSRVDFEQNLMLDVHQFNIQNDQVRIAAKSDTVAAKMFEVTKQRFLIGKIDVLELNNADTKKDQNKRSYIQALNNYWTYYYNMRALTLFDFITRKPLETDYDKLVE
ncbi:MAG: TolC family protein [Bacteroidales bacterium]|jgi:outer membrane protein TolC|nr:TolC family protein [Bacteroidales bacterium]MCB9028627.1 TolC family protein [Bacteroidales bacterium]NLE35927.1 TolC family protein [Bacteroidales bacterium]HNT93107.1 TolC family protein [Bacteroidales bacterium]HOO67150.1 TolC family protein [Bacteroidales bacterium]